MSDRDNPDFLSTNTLKGDKVVNAAGDDLGKIEDFMFDLDNGRVGYVVISFGGFLGLGDKLFAIPWQALSLRVHEHLSPSIFPRMSYKMPRALIKTNGPLLVGNFPDLILTMAISLTGRQK